MPKLAVLLTLLAVLGAASLAACGGKKAGAVTTANAICPVMGGEVQTDDPEMVVEYKGQKIGFCCAGCPQKFKADPEKYMEKMRQDPAKFGYKP